MSVPAINVQRTESGNIIKVDESEPDDVASVPFRVRDVAIKHHDVTQEYDLHEYLGRGRFGEVNKCQLKATGEYFACKKINTERPSDKKEVMLEIEVMKQLQHPMLLQLVDVFEIEKYMQLVTEYIAGGELFDRVIEDEFVLTELACVMFLRQICEGVGFMHSKNVVHLDLKPENILCLTRTGNRIKIIDFGLARHYKPGQQLHVLFGTPEFMAPEVVNYEPISVQADMWSVGVITYILISGLSPFMGNMDSETLANVSRGTYSFDYDDFAETSKECKDFIAKLLLKDPTKRMTASRCLEHSWLKKSRRKMLSVKRMKTTRLKLFVYRRKWQKLVNTIVALKRMGFIMNKNNGGIEPVLGLHEEKPRTTSTGTDAKRESSNKEDKRPAPVSDIKPEPVHSRSKIGQKDESENRSTGIGISDVNKPERHERASRLSPSKLEKKTETKPEEKTSRLKGRQISPSPSTPKSEKQSEPKSEDSLAKRSPRSSPLRSQRKPDEKSEKPSDHHPTITEPKANDISSHTRRPRHSSPIRTEKKSNELPKRTSPAETTSKPRDRIDTDTTDTGIRPRRQSPIPLDPSLNSATKLSPVRSSPVRQYEEPLRSIGRDRRSPPVPHHEEPLHSLGTEKCSSPVRHHENLEVNRRSSPVRHHDVSHLGVDLTERAPQRPGTARNGHYGHSLYPEPEPKHDSVPGTGRIDLNSLVPETNKSYGGQEGPCSLPRVFVERLAPPDAGVAQAPKDGKKKQRMYKPKAKN